MATIINQELEELYNELPKQQSLRNKCESICQTICDRGQYESDKYSITRKIERAFNARTKVRHDVDKLNNWRSECFIEFIPTEEAANSAPVGRKKKRLSEDPCTTTSDKIIEPIIDYLQNVAESECISNHSLLEKVIRLCNKRWGPSAQAPQVSHSVEAATALIYNLDLSLNQYQELRLNLKESSFHLPTRNTVSQHKKTLLPPNIVVEQTKTSCPITDIVGQTVSTLIELSPGLKPTRNAEVNVDSKFGLDGSGSHQKRHQSAQDDDSIEQGGNYIGAFWCPLEIKVGEIVMWSNPVPNSVLYARPVCLIREKENRESVREHFEPILTELHQLESAPTVLHVNDQQCHLHLNAEVSMIDGKMADYLQGDSGAFCHYCNASRLNANDLEKILQGFMITKTSEEVSRIWQLLESGELSYNDAARAGQCHPTMLERNLRFFAILHQKLRSLDLCLKLLYHLVSGQTHTWSESEPHIKDAIAAAKKEAISAIKAKCEFLVDCPTHMGGNTNTGPVSDKFFSAKHRKGICSIILKTTDREAFETLLCYFNKNLSITQNVCATKIAIPRKVRELGYNLMIHYKQNFPWAMISPSVHQMCAHSWELFVLTNGAPIAVYSEQAGESWNKHIRSFKSGSAARARQTSIMLNTQDIFQRMMIKSHPAVASKKRNVYCKRCNRIGHTVRSCMMDVATVHDAEQTSINECYL